MDDFDRMKAVEQLLDNQIRIAQGMSDRGQLIGATSAEAIHQLSLALEVLTRPVDSEEER